MKVFFATALVAVTFSTVIADGQKLGAPATAATTGKTQLAEKLGDQKYRIGTIEVDTAKRELAVPARFNEVDNIEFVATGRIGIKAYESLLSLNTDAVPFNAALLLIGLDPAHSRPSKMQFDPTPPSGDPVELLVESAGDARRIPVEELLIDRELNRPLTVGPWVYSGSGFVPGSNGKVYLAEIEGVLIGLMHGPSAIIDTARNEFITRFGHIAPNPRLAKPGAMVTLIVRALPVSKP